jgi:biotin carboxyl carrier protein
MADRIVAAEIAGVVFSVEAAVGDRVEADQALCILESMKMHIPVEAPAGGLVAEVMAVEGEAVAEGQPLFRLTV